MIRVGLPSPLLLRARLRAHLALTHLSRSTTAARERTALTLASLTRNLTHPLGRTGDAASLAPALAEFEMHYERLVDLLCFAAQGVAYGEPDSRLRDLRVWFRDNYAPLRVALRAHLDNAPEVSRTDGTEPRDDFERLFLSIDVRTLIHSDSLIPIIQRTRMALEACLIEHSVHPVA